MKLEPGVTYYVESEADDSVLLALDAKLGKGAVEWFDTTRDRYFKTLSLEDAGDELRFETERGRYVMRKLTAELYRQKVAGRVDGHPKFTDTEALQQFYRRFPR